MSAPLRVLLLANWGLGRRILETLLAMEHVEVAGVVTRMPEDDEKDPWAGAVHREALRAGCPVHDQEETSVAEVGRLICEANVDVLICHAYMKKLPPEVWQAPRRAAVNVHGSLLPAHRGPSPHLWVLKKREKRTGLTCHLLDDGFDTGPIVCQVPLELSGDETVNDLLEMMSAIAPELIEKSLSNLLNPEFRPQPQDERNASMAPRLTKE